MFRREIKKQFNENKYNMLTAKGTAPIIYLKIGPQMKSQLSHIPFGKQVVGSLALVFIGFNYTKRYMTFPHHGVDTSKPITLPNGELNPYEKQPPVIFINLSLNRALLILIGCMISILSDEIIDLSLLALTLFNSSINA